jgi:hypothetical protein
LIVEERTAERVVSTEKDTSLYVWSKNKGFPYYEENSENFSF